MEFAKGIMKSEEGIMRSEKGIMKSDASNRILKSTKAIPKSGPEGEQYMQRYDR